MPILNERKIITKDGVELAATILTPEDIPKAVIQFHAGTVIRQEFYFKFAQFLCDQGFVVVLFDYRGVGRSRPVSLRGFKASIDDWGLKDASAVLGWIQRTYFKLPIYLFAHSMGGQLLGLMPSWKTYDKVIVVASSSGNWNNFEKAHGRKVKLSTNLFFALSLKFFGYIPGRFGLGQDWPRGIAEDWSANSRKNSLMSDYMHDKIGRTYYEEVDYDIHAFFFEDDPMATPKTLPNYQLTFPNAKVVTHMIKPATYNFKNIGHFGLFKERTKGKLWEDIIKSFTQRDQM